MIDDPDEGLGTVYSNPSPHLGLWLKKVHSAAGKEDTSGILNTRGKLDPVTLIELVAIKRVATGRAARTQLKGGVGVIGEVLAVHETLERILIEGPIPEQALQRLSVNEVNIRFPIGLRTQPNCPNNGSPNWVSRARGDVHRFDGFGTMPILPAIVHEVRDAGGYVGSTPADHSAPVPTAFSSPLEHELSSALGRYLRQSSPRVMPPDLFKVKEGNGHWQDDTLFDRAKLEAWLKKVAPR